MTVEVTALHRGHQGGVFALPSSFADLARLSWWPKEDSDAAIASPGNRAYVSAMMSPTGSTKSSEPIPDWVAYTAVAGAAVALVGVGWIFWKNDAVGGIVAATGLGAVALAIGAARRAVERHSDPIR